MDLSDKRLLFIKQSSLGDVIHTLPVAHAIKRHYPGCRIGWVVEQGFADILERDVAVDGVYPIHIPATSDPDAEQGVYRRALFATISTLFALRRNFKREPYDLVLDLHASFRSGVLALTNPGGVRIGFADARELNTLFQKHHVENPEGKEHALDKNLLFADFLHCTPAREDFFMSTAPEDEQQAAEFMEANGISGGQPFVYSNPAARWETKFWPVEKWARLADRLMEAGTQVVFGGSPKDRTYIASICERMQHAPAVSAGELSLIGSVALLKRAGAYVGLDSGPMHIAAMVQTPVVALFGPTHPERVGPYGVKHVIVRAEGLDCLCCRQRTCDHLSCMKGIGVDQVISGVNELLAPD